MQLLIFVFAKLCNYVDKTWPFPVIVITKFELLARQQRNETTALMFQWKLN